MQRELLLVLFYEAWQLDFSSSEFLVSNYSLRILDDLCEQMEMTIARNESEFNDD